MAYWLFGVDCNGGSPILRGPYPTHGRAEQAENEMDGNIECDIVSLKTRDPAKATRILKERRIGAVGFTEGTRRVRHKWAKF